MITGGPQAGLLLRVAAALLLLPGALAPSPARAAQGTGERPHWRKNFFKRMATDQKYLFATWIPTEASRPSFTIPLAVSVAAATRSDGERGFDYHFQKELAGDAGNIADVLSDLGDISIGLVGGTYLVARWSDQERLARASSLAAEAFFNALIWSDVIKEVTQRTRPKRGGDGKFFVSDPHSGQKNTSFPSGHATYSFALASVFAWEYQDRRWVPWVAYGTAGLIAWSRIAKEEHWPTDVIVGAILGHSLGKMVVARQEGFRRRHRGRLYPMVDPRTGAQGIAYAITW